MRKYHLGIIGYGGFGKFLQHCWADLDSVEVKAISDRKLENEEVEGVRHYQDWKDLIADEGIDIVSIAAPPAFHAEIAIAALQHNKHVLLEKPVALRTEEVEEIMRTAKENNRVITVNHMLRYNPLVQALIGLSETNLLGPLRYAQLSNFAQDASLSPDHWFWDRDISGGIFIEHGVHFFDIVNALTNQKVKDVSGFVHQRNAQQQDQVSATVLYSEGLIANHYHAFSGPGFFEQTTLRLTYDLARIEIEGWVPMKGKFKALVNPEIKAALGALPGFRIGKAENLAGSEDISRPKGWGDVGEESAVRFAGITYDVDEMIEGTFEIPSDKSTVYGQCLKSILSDIIAKIENPEHEMTIAIEHAYEALKVAIRATADASNSSDTE